MIYREAGQFKTSYGADQAMLPIAQDRWAVGAVVAVMLVVVPFISNEYMLQAVLIPFLILSLAAIGLNLLTGYAGQLSLGTAAFMAVGGYMAYKFTTMFPGTQPSRGVPPLRGVRGRGRARLRHSEPSHQGVLPRGGDPRGPVLLELDLQQGPVVLQLQPVRNHHHAAPRDPGGDGGGAPRRRRRPATSSPSWSSSCSRWSPRTSCAEGWAAPGWRSGTWTSRPRSSAFVPTRRSSSPSPSPRSIAGWRGRCTSASISAARRARRIRSICPSRCCSW